jgi:hypothetical protein
MFGWKKQKAPQNPQQQPPIPQALAPAQGNAAELEQLQRHMARQRAGRGRPLSPTPLLDLASGAGEMGQDVLGAATDMADWGGSAAIALHDAIGREEPRPSDYDEVGEAYQVAHDDGWDIGSAASRFGAGGVGVAMDAFGLAKGVYDLQEAGRNRYKATTEAGKMLSNREIKDATLDTVSSGLGLGGGIAAMTAGSVPGLDAGRLLFDAGRELAEGTVSADEARRLHARDLTRKQRNADLAQVPDTEYDDNKRFRTEKFFLGDKAVKRAKLRKFKGVREQWREGTVADDAYAGRYGELHDSERADEIRRHLARHKRRRAADQYYQAGADVVDAAGSFTGGADYGATKLAGKGLKLARGGVRFGRKAVIRAERVHKLRKAKEEVRGVGGVKDKRRSPLWGARQYMLGNVEHQRAKLDAKANGGELDTRLGTAGKLDGFRELTVARDERDARDLQEMATREDGTPHERAVREGARSTAVAAGVMSRRGYRGLEAKAAAAADAAALQDPTADKELVKQRYLNEQLWDARDDRVGEEQANVGKQLLDRQFSH